MNKIVGTFLIGLMLTIGGGILHAEPLDDGMAAEKRGDYGEAAKWFRLAAEQGNAVAQFMLGTLYDDGKGVAQDYREAVKWYRLAAQQGLAEAQVMLGDVYRHGRGVTLDYREALKWFRLAAAQKNDLAQDALGIMYRDGQGVTQNYGEAVKWFRLSAEQGFGHAQFSLGVMYENGQGVAQDYRNAVKWYRLAAQQGLAEAQLLLAGLYNQGKGVAQDYREAVKWYRLAAQQGNANAQGILGALYNEGQGVAQDYVHAYIWSNIAASKLTGRMGELATANRNSAGKNLTPAQLLAAQEMAKRCEESSYKQCDDSEGSQYSYSATIMVPMQREGGIYVVPVLINNAITLNFVVDSGASDVSIPADVVTTLMRTGTLKQSDFLGQKTYVLADGSKFPSQTFRIRSLKVGGKVIENVNGSVATVQGSLLLGQSFLGRFKSWRVDNDKHALVFE